MAFVINDFTVTEYDVLEGYSRTDSDLVLRLEDMTDFTLSQSEDSTDLTGKNGRKIGKKKTGKTLTGSGTYALLSAGLLKVQTGGEITTGTQVVRKSELKTVSGATLVTDATAIGTAGAEIPFLKTVAKNGAIVDVYTQAATADATHYAYDPTTKTITLPIDGSDAVIADGTTVMYAYEREVQGTMVTDPSDKFGDTLEVWVHVFGKDACDNKYFASIVIPRADFSSEFEFDLGGDQITHNFSFEALADLCNIAAGSDLCRLIVYTDGSDPTNP